MIARQRHVSSVAPVVLALMGFGSFIPALAEAPPAGDPPAWEMLDQMWTSVQSDPHRLRLLFSERYYVERFGCTGQVGPYAAHHRIKITHGAEERSRLIVVNRQSFLPPAEDVDADWQRGYHGVHFSEQESLYDAKWRLLRARQWTWGSPKFDPHDDSPPVPERLTFGGGSPKALFYGSHRGLSRTGNWSAYVEGADVVLVESGKEPRRFRLAATRPHADAVGLLMLVAADLVKEPKSLLWGWPPDWKYPVYRDGMAEEDFTGLERRSETVKGKAAVVFRDDAFRSVFFPSTGEHEYDCPAGRWTVSTDTKDGYQNALRKSLKRFKIDKLADDKGNPVDLPLGLKDLKLPVAPP